MGVGSRVGDNLNLKTTKRRVVKRDSMKMSVENVGELLLRLIILVTFLQNGK